jgi:capsid protein
MLNKVIRLFSRAPAAVPQAFDNRFVINDRSGGSKWPSGLSASGSSAAIDHRATRQNARVAMQDNVQARAIVERFADTVADCGLRLELMPTIELLGVTREEATVKARDIEARFHLWAKDKKQHRSETLTFYQSHNLYAHWQQRDNDIFVRLYYSPDRGLQNPLQFEFVDPDQIRGDAYTTTYGFQFRNDGIKRDSRGRESGYTVWIRNESGQYTDVTIPARGEKSSRLFMLHGFRPEYAGQGRGFSRLAHAIQDFETITDFSSAAIKKAINQSNIVGFVEPSATEDATNPFEGILTDAGAGPAAEQFGANPVPSDTATNVTADSLNRVECYQVPEATTNTPGSMFITNLQKGQKIQFMPNTAPGDSFDSFVDSFAGHLSASLSIPLEVVLMKFGQNYSASRATLLLFWRVCLVWRSEMASDYLDPIVEMWLSGEIAAGRVSLPGWSDPRLRAAWLNCNWIGAPPPDIDPSKTADARRKNIEIGVTNLDREARDHNGSSAATNIEKNRTLYEDFPVAPWTPVGGGGEPQPAPAARDEEDDE